MRVNLSTVFAAVILSGIGTAQAKDKNPPPRPQAWQEVVKCKALTETAARLACYDEQVGKLEQAAASGDVVMADKAAVRDAKKGLFGFKLPSFGIFGGDDDNEVESLEGNIATARTFGYGAWRITLVDGSVWEQTDDERLVFDPGKGNKVRIYKGALGTFKMNIDGQRAIKVRRVE